MYKHSKPLLDPLRQRELARLDVRARVDGMRQPAEFFARISERAANRCCESLAGDAVSQPPYARRSFV
jgi:hypothetical protein